MAKLIVLTRFNLAIKFKYSRNDTEIPVWSEAPWLEEEYLRKRFVIFERYTLPSLMKQTDNDFEWIILFHKDTPDVFKDKIREIEGKMSQIKAMWFNDEECNGLYHSIVREYIKQNYREGDIITCRIDNDDVLYKTFIEECKKQFENIEKTSVLTYVNGYQYDSRNNNIINYDFYNNHFLSLYVPEGEPVEHILAFNHSRIFSTIQERGFGKIEKRTEIPMWIEIITQTNCANHMMWKFNSFFVPFKVRDEYPEIDLKWNSKLQWLSYVVGGTCMVPFYYLRDMIKSIVRKR